MVAPCPHDGVCPMQGTRSWCHFVQRFERSSLQRVTKLRQGGGLARTYQVLIPSSHHAACRFLIELTYRQRQAWQAGYALLNHLASYYVCLQRSGLSRGCVGIIRESLTIKDGVCNLTSSDETCIFGFLVSHS